MRSNIRRPHHPVFHSHLNDPAYNDSMLRLFALLFAGFAAIPSVVVAQGQVAPIVLPRVVVTAQKEPADAQTLPVSVTAVSRDTLVNAGITILREAAIYAPNVHFSDFTARKLSNARFRGIGSSPANPAVTTYIDGVPQLHANTSSMDLLDVERVEFVRGPQSALFGRNTLAGVINVVSTMPSLTDWTRTISVPLGNFSSREFRGTVSGPLSSGRLGVSGAFAYTQRDGFTRNVLTDTDVDDRSALIGKGQLLWVPSPTWETRLVVTGERARDGDYALSDLDALKASPFSVERDFEGRTSRDVMGTTFLARRVGDRVNLSSTTGLVTWKTLDETDLDYTRLPLVTRKNTEESLQFTQEVRAASTDAARFQVSEHAILKWQAGALLFTQNYDQEAMNTISPFVLSPLLPFRIVQHAPAALDDFGVGVYGQATTTFDEVIDIVVGARFDRERKTASLSSFTLPAITPPTAVDAEETFSNVSPQVSIAYRLQDDRMVYGAIGRGFKAGGFNAASPPGFQAFGEELTWNLEGGVKTTWRGGAVTANAAVFRIDWDDLQLNLPDPRVPAQFYIANVGAAVSSGAEFEVNARVQDGLDLFGALGFTNATFKQGSVSGGASVGGLEIPNTPDYTATVGAQVSRALRADRTLYGRGEVALSGAFRYDDLNRAGQDAYALTNFRGGLRAGSVFAEAWVRNAFDTRYIPVAFPFAPTLAPSGFLGEMGAPRTFGINVGVTF
jgi:iron complex outermembrane receptor protein